MRRYGLRDDQWDRIKDLLPGREGHVGGTAEDNRLFVEAVLYRFRTGCRPPSSPQGSIGSATCRALQAGLRELGYIEDKNPRSERPRRYRS
jgi:transposase